MKELRRNSSLLEFLGNLFTRPSRQAVYHSGVVLVFSIDEVDDAFERLALALDNVFQVRSVERLGKRDVVAKSQLVNDIFPRALVCGCCQGNDRNIGVILSKLA